MHSQLSDLVRALEQTSGTGFMVDSQFRITFCNSAWDQFALANGAPQLVRDAMIGFDLFAAIPDVLKPFYSEAFQRVLNTGEIWEKPYECSSPALFRQYLMRIHLVKPQEWFVITNPLMVERPQGETTLANPAAYVDKNGFITNCAHWRSSRRASKPDQWDFVPEYVNHHSKVTHALCPVCRAYFYKHDE